MVKKVDSYIEYLCNNEPKSLKTNNMHDIVQRNPANQEFQIDNFFRQCFPTNGAHYSCIGLYSDVM
jgi:hypothetical protein